MNAETAKLAGVDDRFKLRIIGQREIALSDSFVLRGEQRLYDATKINFSPGSQEELISRTQDGMFFIVYATHKSHYDGRPLGKATGVLRKLVNPYLPEGEKLEGFAMPIAASIAAGYQGQEVKKAVEMFSKLNEKQDQFYLVDYVRTKDEIEYGMRPNTREYLTEMKRHLAENHGIALLPEATVEGGRRFENGDLIGLQPLEPGSIYATARWAAKQGKNPVIVPMALSGTYNVFTPGRTHKEYKVPTNTVIRATVPMVPHDIVGVTIGNPIDLDQAVYESSTNGSLNLDRLDLYFARRLAEITPENELGGFGKHLLAKPS